MKFALDHWGRGGILVQAGTSSERNQNMQTYWVKILIKMKKEEPD